MPDSIQTYGLISGLWTSTFALGAFIGPSVSGFLYDLIGFRHAVIFIIGSQFIVGLISLVYYCVSKRRRANYKELASDESLILRPRIDSQTYGTVDENCNGHNGTAKESLLKKASPPRRLRSPQYIANGIRSQADDHHHHQHHVNMVKSSGIGVTACS